MPAETSFTRSSQDSVTAKPSGSAGVAGSVKAKKPARVTTIAAPRHFTLHPFGDADAVVSTNVWVLSSATTSPTRAAKADLGAADSRGGADSLCRCSRGVGG